MTWPAAVAALTGLGFHLSLILAIGAQNAYVLRQGLRREHVAVVVGICVVSDLILIMAGVAGMGTLVQHLPALVLVIRFAGAAFLLAYAGLAARRALRSHRLRPDSARAGSSVQRVALTAAALTWLNPHVYLDTVVLGAIASTHGEYRWAFGAGAVLGSLLWFSALGLGARRLGPVFDRPGAWRLLDGAIALVMAAIGVRLLIGL